MSKRKLRAIVAGGGIALSAGTGIATNFLTEQLSWALGAVVAVLVIAGVALAVATSMLDNRTAETEAARADDSSDDEPTPAPTSPSPGPGGISQHSGGGSQTQVGGNYYRNGMSAGYVVLSLVVVAAAAVAVLLVALRFAPSPTRNSAELNTPIVTTSSATTTAAPVPEDLRYDVAASRNREREVKVKATAHGQPEPGLTYWFVVEVNYGDNVEYYPRRKLTGRTTSFDIQLSADADLKYPRIGRIYGLTSAQNAEAALRQQRQETTKKDDYFVKTPGQPASDPVEMPF